MSKVNNSISDEIIIKSYVYEKKTLKEVSQKYHIGVKRIKKIVTDAGYKIRPQQMFWDLSGQKFNKLTAIKQVGVKANSVLYLCKCECGGERIVKSWVLKCGRVKDCGCVSQKNRNEIISEKNKTHGDSKTRLYSCWIGIKSRCYRQKDKYYKDYGGRGIKVCNEWIHNYEQFRDWALKNGYKDNLTIDRIDVNDDYKPSNCRWITMTEQTYNKRNTRKIYLNGIGKTASEWSKIFPLTSPGIYGFAKNNNWQLAPYLKIKNIKIEDYYV